MIKVRVYIKEISKGINKTFKSFKSMKNWLKNNPEFSYDHLSIILV